MHSISMDKCLQCGPVAQSVEQRTENPCVDSSILSWPTIDKTRGCGTIPQPLFSRLPGPSTIRNLLLFGKYASFEEGDAEPPTRYHNQPRTSFVEMIGNMDLDTSFFTI